MAQHRSPLCLGMESATAPAHYQGPPQTGRARLQPGHKDTAPKQPALPPQPGGEPAGRNHQLPSSKPLITTTEDIPLPVKSLEREYLTLNPFESNTLPPKKPPGRQALLPHNHHVLNTLKGKTGKRGGGGVPPEP